MNYRHAFHAGNHADVLKHIVVLALCDALTTKPTPCFALDTHAGRGLYALAGSAALKTGESDDGIGKLAAGASKDPLLARYLAAVHACRLQHGRAAYPGSPWLLAHALRAQDHIAAWELQPIEAAALQRNFGDDKRLQIHAGDGYSAIKASLPPKDGSTRISRGLVLIDPPYEMQLQEFDAALAALREGLRRWPQGMFALWYPIKLRRALHNFYRRAATLPAKSALIVELLVRPDDSPLRMNGSGMLLLNAPWKLDHALGPALGVLRKTLGEAGANHKIEWLRAPE
ncbi:MAG: 23S rRNA (adenine(2030)-N(6))-methyltransferase RlmJ [Luteimonas sp.]